MGRLLKTRRNGSRKGLSCRACATQTGCPDHSSAARFHSSLCHCAAASVHLCISASLHPCNCALPALFHRRESFPAIYTNQRLSGEAPHSALPRSRQQGQHCASVPQCGYAVSLLPCPAASLVPGPSSRAPTAFPPSPACGALSSRRWPCGRPRGPVRTPSRRRRAWGPAASWGCRRRSAPRLPTRGRR